MTCAPKFRLRLPASRFRDMWVAVKPERRLGYFWTTDEASAYVFLREDDADMVRKFLPCPAVIESFLEDAA